MCNSKQTNSLEKRDLCKKYGPAMSVFPLIATLTATTFAKDLNEAIISILNGVGTLLTSVFGPLCILVLGLAIVSILVGKNSKSAEQGMEWAKRACICFVVFNLLGAILTWGFDLFNGLGTNVSDWGNVSTALIHLL